MSNSKRTWTGRVYTGRTPDGKQQFWWVGRFAIKRERDLAVAAAKLERPWETRRPDEATITIDELAARYLRRYDQAVDRGVRKRSSYDTVERELRRFRRLYGDELVAHATPLLAEEWATTVPRSSLPRIRAVFGYATRLEILARNPFDGIGGPRSRGRADEHPPTIKELQALLDACDVLGDYAPRMRDLIEFAGLTLMRPGELYELRYPDIDLRANRIHVHRRVFRGQLDTPKTGRRTIALVPPARAIVLRQPTRTRDDGLVFATKTGQRLATSTVSGYWAQIKARAGLDHDFYLATKHLGVHRLYALGLSKRAIAAQAGWSERDVDQMLAVYAHVDLVALAEVDALYADQSDAGVTQAAAKPQQTRGL
jgi:integrase